MKENYYYRQYERERTITNAITIVRRARAKDRAIKKMSKELMPRNDNLSGSSRGSPVLLSQH